MVFELFQKKGKLTDNQNFKEMTHTRALGVILIITLNSLSILGQNRPEIHSKHWIHGYPYGTPVTNDLIIRDVYALSNNDDTKFADWVAYRLNPDIISGPSKSRNWAPDPWLDPSETLEPYPDHGDYKDAHSKINTDRGHQAPLASFDGSPSWFETNYFSNITPQKSNLNQGPWKKLEMQIRDMVEELSYLIVYTGPLYERDMPPLPNADETHKVPSGYWKIVLYTNEDDYIEPLAFIFDQDTPRGDKIGTHLTTIDEIEKRSGLDFLWELADYKENAIEKNLNKDWFDEHIKEN